MNKRILFLTPYPHGQAPSQRFRFEQYFAFLSENGYEIETRSFLSDKTWKALYNHGSFFQKVIGVLASFMHRFLLMFQLRKYDLIFIHREASMIGPPIFEWFIAKVLRKKYIYDFDDAIWLPNYSQQNAKFHKLKAYGKVKKIIRWADKVAVGNKFLKEFALQYNKNIQILPTTIDLENVHTISCDQESTPINIGWTGTHTTLSYLKELIPVLEELEQQHNFTFTVISNQAPDFNFKSLRYIQWSKETEIEDLSQFQIGVMPLTENDWAKGKCGFKALQYMALKIPSIVSPVGVNTSIIEDKKNGYLCNSPEEWKKQLEELILSKELRIRIGENGQETVKNQFSVAAQRSNFINLFE